MMPAENIGPKLPMPVDPDIERVEDWFALHRPTEEQRLGIHEIRSALKMVARKIVRHCPAGQHRTVALRKMLESLDAATNAIVCRK